MTITPTNQPQAITTTNPTISPKPVKPLVYPAIIGAIAVTIVGLTIDNIWLGLSGTLVILLVSVPILWGGFQRAILSVLSPDQKAQILSLIALFLAIAVIFRYFGFYGGLVNLGSQLQWDAIGSLAEWTGAVGQIFIAVLAVYIAWQQYVISRDLTIEQNRLTTQQNIITQQQTIDTYFQGISDLALDDKGFLEDWPQEQAFAEGRTAALLSSIDAAGRAKVLRFLSQSKLITPLQRDRRLGRPMLNGDGGYAEDRLYGVRVIDLGVMLAGSDLAGTDLRWTDLSEANLVRANLSNCDLVKANFSRTILYEAKLSGADIKGARFHYGAIETASPRSRIHPPDYQTGANTGAVVEDADFTNVQCMSEEQRYYCCAWGGETTRATIPGGCAGIPNRLELARQIARINPQEPGGNSDAEILSDRSSL
ncbi:pentapeptide repeat-containing protein [Merismopedia glauca]|uniref:Low-complexity protein n=1 Tax=Merismopedia glauca CCAP 1448/3 TaxID=1296344 RepID=A0A2T1C381_9CYAN|nr:pentapeptide repeat-containing protein [Merismopedia glauca]PSB02721.1 low-complexity protein [Merismopedia glauca CCAP 1448/3]